MLLLAACLVVAMTHPALAANTCDEVYQASIKTVQTPHHLYYTITQGTGTGKLPAGEAVYVGGIRYSKMDGKWRRGLGTPQEELEFAKEKVKMTMPDTCTRVGDETIGSQAVSVYKGHNNLAGNEQVFRIFRSSGLLQSDTVSQSDQVVEMRYEYTNVQAPANAQ
ncbi:MAG: hypothetical protein M3Y55_07065 [Pseudomonadota bacterium]|nr:hypothetical protein [Pseudomonadota bacterium]